MDNNKQPQPEAVAEGNKLIMLFDGWEIKKRMTFDPDHNGGSNWYEVFSKNGRTVRIEDVEFDIVYHQSWNALMPVVEKIEDKTHKGFSISVNIFGQGAAIYINPTDAGGNKYEGKREIANTLNCNYFNDYLGAKKVSKIVAVWQAVVEFIKWYNKQKEAQP